MPGKFVVVVVVVVVSAVVSLECPKERAPASCLLGGNGVRPGPAVRSPIRAPSSDGEIGNAAARDSFRVEIFSARSW
jgi:hypothetical protein